MSLANNIPLKFRISSKVCFHLISSYFQLLPPCSTHEYDVSKPNKSPCGCIRILFPLSQCVTSAEDLSSSSVLIPHPLSLGHQRFWVNLVKQILVPQSVLAHSSFPSTAFSSGTEGIFCQSLMLSVVSRQVWQDVTVVNKASSCYSSDLKLTVWEVKKG